MTQTTEQQRTAQSRKLVGIFETIDPGTQKPVLQAVSTRDGNNYALIEGWENWLLVGCKPKNKSIAVAIAEWFEKVKPSAISSPSLNQQPFPSPSAYKPSYNAG